VNNLLKMINYEKEWILINKKEIKAVRELSSSYLNASCDQVNNHIHLIDQINHKFSQKSFIDSLFWNSKIKKNFSLNLQFFS